MPNNWYRDSSALAGKWSSRTPLSLADALAPSPSPLATSLGTRMLNLKNVQGLP